MRKYSTSPERRPRQPSKKVSPKIPVVYYLCRNNHLEHPHFIEVPISSHDGAFYLKDFTKRLIELRGKGMPFLYSWSCKRSYKNGFVWHDLCEEDLILPVHGNEYVIKGSEILNQSPPDRSRNGNITPKPQNAKPHSKTQLASSSSPPTVIKELKTLPSPSHAQEEKERSSDSDSSNASEFKLYKPTIASDASTQTDNTLKKKTHERSTTQNNNTCTRGVSTDDCPTEPELDVTSSSSAASSSNVKLETLENLIRAEPRKMNSSFRVLEEDEDAVFMPTLPKLRAGEVLLQLITCGSLSVKDSNRICQVKFPSPMLAGSLTLGELNCISDNSRLKGLRSIENKEYFSASLIETKKRTDEVGDGAVATLKRSSSFNADRGCKSLDMERDTENMGSKCLPRAIKIPTPTKQFKSSILRSPMSDCPRISSANSEHFQQDGSKKIIDNISAKGSSSMRLESYKEEKDKVIKIEERLISGARVIIQSRAPCSESEGSSSS